jgi:hypothetical protein
LTLGLILGWFIGLRTLHEGYVTLRILDNPLVGDTLAFPAGVREALVASVAGNAQVSLPIAVAQLLLGGLLLGASVTTLFGGTRNISYSVQAVIANGVLVCGAYAMGGPVRQALALALATTTEPALPVSETLAVPELLSAYLWGFRLAFGLHIVTLAGVAWALSRRSVREFLTFTASHPTES